jgi:glutathione S-transferase
MKLYYSPGACSMSPHIVIAESGLPVDLVKVSLKSHQLEDGTDYYTVNPKGAVPALRLDDGALLTEGPAIVQYLADKAPAAKLAPAAGSLERYRLQEWLNYLTSEIHKSLGLLFDKSIGEDFGKSVREKLGKRFAYIAGQLGDKPYLMGNQFSVADAYLFTLLSWQDWLGLDIGPLKPYYERVKSRPKVAEVLKAEGRAK